MENDLKDLSITVASPYNRESIALLDKLREELCELYPDELEGVSFHPDEVSAPGSIFLLARIGDAVVGCGAVRPQASGIAELKRMFVTGAARGRGVGRKLLQALELEAQNLGYQSIKLETGLKQPRAIALYESAGFVRMPCYGQYSENPMSICFEKNLSGKP
jgi:GNAT superfamily N-acetyltransferase